MIAKLKYVEGAIPGKPIRKRKSLSQSALEKDKKKTYEANRPQRKFSEKWKEGRPWLEFSIINNTMTCSYCVNYTKTNHATPTPNPLAKLNNPFVNGCSNLRISSVAEISKTHIKATQLAEKEKMTGVEILQKTEAGRALSTLHQADKNRLLMLFKNAHAVIKNNRPLRDFEWICKLDSAKGLNIGHTYLNQKAALDFGKCMAEAEQQKLKESMNDVKFISFLMDGSTDISGDEEEAVYIRFSKKGKVTEKFLAIGSPNSTTCIDLKEFFLDVLDKNDIDKGKVVCMGSDGASNMVGNKGGLITLLRQEINMEMLNVHCFAHRLELAFRDVLKKNRLYDKLVSLLVGFYTKQYKNKHGLQRSIALFGGVLPTKVTGTRWLPHLSRGIQGLLRTYKAYESHLSSSSHTNPKAEGLYKILISKDLMCFTLFLQSVLDPLMRLSLKLQQPESNVYESLAWVETTLDLLEELKSKICEAEISMVVSHFSNTLQTHCLPLMDPDSDLFQEALAEWRTLKRILYRRHGTNLMMMSWAELYDPDFPIMMTIMDLLLCIPATSVRCETTFLQMKLIKTSRRTKLRTSTLNDLMTVKLESTGIEDYDIWLSKSIQRRHLNYKRKVQNKETTVTDGGNAGQVEAAPVEMVEDNDAEESDESVGDLDLEALDIIYTCSNDESECYFEDFCSEDENWKHVDEFSREE